MNMAANVTVTTRIVSIIIVYQTSYFGGHFANGIVILLITPEKFFSFLVYWVNLSIILTRNKTLAGLW